MKWQFNLERRNFGRQIDVQIFCPRDDGSTDVVRQLVAERIPQDDCAAFVEAPLTLRIGQAQQLMDALWHCGLRPSEGTGSAGSLAATQEHLKDMRAIAMGLLRLEGDVS